MTVASTYEPKRYSGNDITTNFSFPYEYRNTSDLVVYEVDANGNISNKVENTDYTVTTVGSSPTFTSATVVMVTAPATGVTLVIERVLDFEQDSDYVTSDPAPSDTVEGDFDRLMMLAQQNNEGISRALKFKASSAYTNPELADPSSGKLLAWDAFGNIVNVSTEEVGSITVDGLSSSLKGLATNVIDARDYEIWTITGQSNATQKNTGGATAVNSKVYAWDNSGGVFNVAEIGVAPFDDATKNCIAIEFGRKRQEITGKTIYLVWEAVGGRRIAHWLPFTEPTITGVTQANPAVVSYTGGTGLREGDAITINDVVGMTELNGNNYLVSNLDTGAGTFELQNTSGVDIDSTGYTAYSSGGEVDLNYYVYDVLKTKLTAALAALNLSSSTPINGNVFMQGESDNSNDELFGYYTDLKALIARYAAETYWSDYSKFISCEVANTPINDRANVGISLVAREGNDGAFKVVNSRYRETTDGVHFTGAEITAMGQEAAYTVDGLITYAPPVILTNSFVHDLDDNVFDDVNEFFDWVEDVQFVRGAFVTVTLKTGSNSLTKSLYGLLEGKNIILKSSFINSETAPPLDTDMTGTRSTDLATVKGFYDGYLECSSVNGFLSSKGTVYLDTTALIGDSTATAIGFDGRDQVTRAGGGTLIVNDVTIFGFDGSGGKGVRVYNGLLQEANSSSNLSIFHCVNGIEAYGSQVVLNNLIIAHCSGIGLFGDYKSYFEVPTAIINNCTSHEVNLEGGSIADLGNAVITGNIEVGKMGCYAYVQGATYSTSNRVEGEDASGNAILTSEAVYKPETFTPTFDFATTGDLSVTYNTATGVKTRVGDTVFFDITLNITLNAYTTASGNAEIGGFGDTFAGTSVQAVGEFSQVDLPTNRTQFSSRAISGQGYLRLQGIGDANNASNLTESNFAAGGTYTMYISGHYKV